MVAACQSLDPIRRRLHSHSEPNWWIKYGKRATSESIWCGSFSLLRQKGKFDRVCWTFVELNLDSTHGAPSESDVAQCRSKVELIQLGSAHERSWKVGRLNLVWTRPYSRKCGHFPTFPRWYFTSFQEWKRSHDGVWRQMCILSSKPAVAQLKSLESLSDSKTAARVLANGQSGLHIKNRRV